MGIKGLKASRAACLQGRAQTLRLWAGPLLQGDALPACPQRWPKRHLWCPEVRWCVPAQPEDAAYTPRVVTLWWAAAPYLRYSAHLQPHLQLHAGVAKQ